MARVFLEGVSKVFPGRVTAVEHLHLEVEDGEFMVLVGPSGCGKSTTLRMIAGLEEISEGSVYIGQRRVNQVAPKDRNISMVFQNYALYPHMSVYKNMAFGLQLRYGGGVIARTFRRLVQPAKAAELTGKRRGIKQRVQQAARMLGIEHLLNRMPRQLSGGERQRVALGRAIVREPAAFLFDEPLSNLDAKLRVEMRRELKRLHQQLGTTMVYVTHDQIEALTLGQRVAVMDRGKIQQVGLPLEVYDRPANRFVAGFIGTPPMNFVDGELRKSGGQWEFVGSKLRTTLPSQRIGSLADRRGADAVRVSLGLRPEHVVVKEINEDADSSREKTANRARVLVVESLGDSTVVHLELIEGEGRENTAKQHMVCKTGPRAALKPADLVCVELDTTRAHLFDAETGESLL